MPGLGFMRGHEAPSGQVHMAMMVCAGSVADRGGNGILDELPSHPTAQVPIADAQSVRAHGEPMATRIPGCVAQNFRHARHQAPLMTIERILLSGHRRKSQRAVHIEDVELDRFQVCRRS